MLVLTFTLSRQWRADDDVSQSRQGLTVSSLIRCRPNTPTSAANGGSGPQPALSNCKQSSEPIPEMGADHRAPVSSGRRQPRNINQSNKSKVRMATCGLTTLIPGFKLFDR